LKLDENFPERIYLYLAKNMNVLVIIPENHFREKYRQGWELILSPTDNLFFLSLKNGKNESNHGVMPNDYNFSKNVRFLNNLITKYSSWEGPFHKFWIKLVRNQFIEIIFCIRSFDPDIVDFRSLKLESEFIEKFSKGLNPVKTIFKNNIDSLEKNSPLWRLYDPETVVSIILPVHNGEKYVRKSIESCLVQTHKNFELIIIDDCSTDNTPTILQEYARQDSRIKLFHNTSNKRLPSTLNIGFSHSTGDLLTWTSDDNYFDPEAIKNLVCYLNTWKDIDFVYSAYRIIDEKGTVKEIINYLPPPWNLPIENTVGAYFLYRRSVYESVGDFDREMEYLEDYDYWVRVYLKKIRMMRLHIPMYYYRHHPESMTADAKQKNEKIWDKVRLKYFNK
jgi:hypothetical protein